MPWLASLLACSLAACDCSHARLLGEEEGGKREERRERLVVGPEKLSLKHFDRILDRREKGSKNTVWMSKKKELYLDM